MVDVTLPHTGSTDQTKGGNPNSWGDIADANFRNFDNRFGATATIVTTGGDETLNDAQSVVALIKITGVLASNANIIFPATRGGMWLVENATSGAYTVRCKLSGQTGIAIAAGETRLIFNNGTDMADPDTAAAFLPLAGGTMTGPIAMGGSKITGLGAATTAGDAVRYEQVFPSVFQPLDATLTALAALTIASGKVIYGTGSDAFAQADSTAAGRTLWNWTDPNADRIAFWDDSESAFAALTLGTGLSINATTLSLHALLAGIAGLTATDNYFLVGNGTIFTTETPAQARSSLGLSANGDSLVTAANYAAMRALLDLEAGTDFYSIAAADAAFQPKDADLTALAAVSTTAAGLTILSWTDPNADRIPFWDDSGGLFTSLTLDTGLSITGTTMSLAASLAAIAGLSPAADRLPYYTAGTTAALATFTATARSLLDDASTADMRTTLGLVIGTNVQAYDAQLASLAALASVANLETLAALSSVANLSTVAGYASLNNLTELLALSLVADRLPYADAVGSLALATFTAAARSLLDDADASTMRSTLGLVIGTNVQAYDAQLASLAALTSVANLEALAGLTLAADRLPYANGAGSLVLTTFTSLARTLLDDTTQGAMQSTLGLVPGTNVQAYDAQLASLAALASVTNLTELANLSLIADRLPYANGTGSMALATFTSAGRSLLAASTAAAIRAVSASAQIGTLEAIDEQTGASYSPAIGNLGTLITMNRATAQTLTVPANATTAFAVGAVLHVQQIGAGLVTIQAAGGVTLNGVVAGSCTMNRRYSMAVLVKTATNTWTVAGGVGTVA